MIDATGLQCPLPVLKTQKQIRDLAKGTIIIIHATDKNAPSDFEDFCSLTSNTLLETKQVNGIYEIKMHKG